MPWHCHRGTFQQKKRSYCIKLQLHIREPVVDDGRHIHHLVDRCKPLDLNSLYNYLIICEHFHGTTVVAENNNSIVGYISAYIHPDRTDTLFVWQVAVDESMRKMGLAMKMLQSILVRDTLKKIRYIETTVTPSNRPSQRFFERFAQSVGAECIVSEFFMQHHFGDKAHEEENLYRIGPFNTAILKKLIEEK